MSVLTAYSVCVVIFGHVLRVFCTCGEIFSVRRKVVGIKMKFDCVRSEKMLMICVINKKNKRIEPSAGFELTFIRLESPPLTTRPRGQFIECILKSCFINGCCLICDLMRKPKEKSVVGGE
jgi:hypothetical protein